MLRLVSMALLVCGAVSVSVGLWIGVFSHDIFILLRISEDVTATRVTQSPSFIEISGYLTTTSGVALLFVSVIGCWASTSAKDAKSHLPTLIVGMILTTVHYAVAVALVVRYNIMFRDYALEYMNTSFTGRYMGPYSRSYSISTAWDVGQVVLQCCGVSGQGDYDGLETWDRTWRVPGSGHVYEARIPVTCCFFKSGSRASDVRRATTPEDFHKLIENPNCPHTRTFAYSKGCLGELRKTFRKNYYLIVITAGISLVIMSEKEE
ncbi:tetraspanin-1-like isoform X3 [Gigantopelta aegis]|uniref:tetraspanin-1-like isoform X3 n=1 Tax=Gigantopelta aegis TaxID=1735272 RepID=UPI001B889021|nr:tetraspanin-1-like isoform X3 [Gigantopelta aegis]